MFKNLMNLFQKRSLLARTVYLSNESEIIFGPNVEVFTHPTSQVKLNGKLILGISLTGLQPGFSHKPNTVIFLGKNATLIINGNVQFAPGCTIRVGENGTLDLAGKNIIAHDTTIISTRKISLGSGASISWNCTLIDDDGHSFYRINGKKIKRLRKPISIGDNVGIQMNVVIPSGVSIGDNSIVSANTVVRKDIPKDSLVYSMSEYKLLPNYTTGFQFQ